MNRRSRHALAIFLCLVILAPAAMADLPKIPSRNTFSMGYDRLQTAIHRGQPVKWRVTVSPESMMAVQDGTMGVLQFLLSAVEFSGVVQCLTDGGGWVEVSALSGGKEIASIGQMEKDGRVGLNLNGVWISVADGSQAQAAAMLTLDELGESLMALDYSGLRAGDIPFLTPIVKYGKRLWELASPYSEDNNRLRVSSGATGHGTSYTIDTAAARQILGQWVDELSADDLSLGLGGLGLSIGVGEEAMDAFVGRMRTLAETIELSKPITFNMAFGEGDILGNAKGSGTLQESGGRTNVSYTYSCALSSTRITRKYNMDFQPKQGDTIALKCTALTSSNNKSSGAQEMALDASGVFDGKPYRIKLNSEMINRYVLGDDGLLTEDITGKMSVLLTYDGVVVADIALEREGQTQSAVAKKAITVRDTYHADIKDSRGTLFRGEVALAFDVEDEPQTSPEMKSTQYIELMDFIDIETLRDSLQVTLADVKRNLLAAISGGEMQSLLGLY